MSLSDARAAVVETLTTLFPAFRVEAHGGSFTESELAMLLGHAPCLLVAVLRLHDYASIGMHRWSASVDWVAVLLAKDGASQRAELALESAHALIACLPGQRWGLGTAACKPPDMASIDAQNLYSGHANNLSIAAWAVSWTQTFTFEDAS